MVLFMDEGSPVRKRLYHSVPEWVSPGAQFFITINAGKRGSNELCSDAVAGQMIESVEVYQRKGLWWMHLFLVMPDHVHFIASFPDNEFTSVVKTWKGYHARHSGVSWQSGFFDHRLRNIDEVDEKASYIRQNPVRGGLVEDDMLWPYVWSQEG